MASPLIFAAIIVATATASALAAMLLLTAFPETRGPARQSTPDAEGRAVFLFQGAELIDATAAARRLLSTIDGAARPWEAVASHLAGLFPGFAARIAAIADQQSLEMRAGAEDAMVLRAEMRHGMLRLALSGAGMGPADDGADTLCRAAQECELGQLRSILNALPTPICRTDDSGTVTWANRAYLAQSARTLGVGEDDLTWPLPQLFERVAEGGGTSRQRTGTSPEDSEWFDCQRHDLGDGVLTVALPADALARAETALREFVQTLTKTFADLPIGLAVFDRNRQLAMFNPALVDLTRLDAVFLSSRPSLFDVLDRMRDGQIAPEPKDYQTWRYAMVELEMAAARGQYEETWSLPTGQTYRVIGRPHPDGAIAFLFEDITAEVSLSRRFRAEIELGQQVLDHFDEPVAVFSAAGTMVLANAALTAEWGLDPAAVLGSYSVEDAVRRFAERVGAAPEWQEVRNSLLAAADDDRMVRLGDGSAIRCRISGLSDGSALLRMSALPDPSARLRRLRRQRRALLAEAAPA